MGGGGGGGGSAEREAGWEAMTGSETEEIFRPSRESGLIVHVSRYSVIQAVLIGKKTEHTKTVFERTSLAARVGEY